MVVTARAVKCLQIQNGIDIGRNDARYLHRRIQIQGACHAMNARNAIVEAVLEDAADDYVPDWTIRHIAQRLSGAQSWSDVEAAVVEALDLMLTAGWVEIGDLVSGRGFLRWDGDNESVMRRVRRSWRAAGPDFHPGDICWLRITPSGELRPEAASPSP